MSSENFNSNSGSDATCYPFFTVTIEAIILVYIIHRQECCKRGCCKTNTHVFKQGHYSKTPFLLIKGEKSFENEKNRVIFHKVVRILCFSPLPFKTLVWFSIMSPELHFHDLL